MLSDRVKLFERLTALHEWRERFSTFGRFSAATRRLSKLFSDTEFVARLLQEDAARVSEELRQVRSVIDRVFTRLGS